MHTDGQGNKIAEKKISKQIQSVNIRRHRSGISNNNRNLAFCNECGFRIRSRDHAKGSHHRMAVR